jgi:H+/gluconate symporter-like permease
VKISQNFTTALLEALIFFYAVFIFVNSLLLPLNKNAYSQSVKVAVISLQPLVHHATVPHHPHDVPFANCLSKGRTGKNLIVQAMTVC